MPKWLKSKFFWTTVYPLACIAFIVVNPGEKPMGGREPFWSVVLLILFAPIILFVVGWGISVWTGGDESGSETLKRERRKAGGKPPGRTQGETETFDRIEEARRKREAKK